MELKVNGVNRVVVLTSIILQDASQEGLDEEVGRNPVDHWFLAVNPFLEVFKSPNQVSYVSP